MRVLSALVALILTASPSWAGMSCRADTAIFLTADGPLPIQVEIADTDAKRAQGLMFRKELAPQSGMLFIYDPPQRMSFWMRNTLIPLDLIFIDEAGVVRHIHADARPLDETSIPGAGLGDPDPLRKMVVEIAGGEAQRLGIRPGMAMAHPSIEQLRAAAPCK